MQEQPSTRKSLMLAVGVGIVTLWLLLQLTSIALDELTDITVMASAVLAAVVGYAVYVNDLRHRATERTPQDHGRLRRGQQQPTSQGPRTGVAELPKIPVRRNRPPERLRILVVGGGEVAQELMALVSGEGHELVVVEQDPQRAERLRAHVDGLVVTGNGSDPDILAEAEITEADVLVAVTDRDEVNVLACMLARNHGLRTVARIRNPALFKDSEVVTQRRLGIDVVINPERTTAAELAQLVQSPVPVEELAYFASGRIQMVGFPVREGAQLAGRQLRDLPLDKHYLVVMVEREDESLEVPHGTTRINVGDRVYVMGPTGLLSEIAWLAGSDVQRPRAVMVLGGGLIGGQTAQILERSGLEVKILDADEEVCRQLSVQLTKATVVVADAADPDVLLREGLDDFDALVAATGDDRTNLLMGYFARRSSGLRVVTELLDARYEVLAEWLKIDAYVSPRVATAGRVMSLLHAAEHVTGIRILQHQRAEVFEAVVTVGAPITGGQLGDLDLPEGVLVGGILRGTHVISPRGAIRVRAGDRVVLFGLPDKVDVLGDLLRGTE